MKESRYSKGVIFIFLAGCSFIVAVYWIMHSRKNIDTSTWVVGVGTVTHVNYGRGSAGEMEYTYMGKQYNGSGRINCGMHLGEKYVIKINPNNPTDYVALAWKPIFEDFEETYESTGEIVRIYKTYASLRDVPKYELEYVYKINEAEYKAVQGLPPSYKAGTYHVGQHFKVEFGGVGQTRAILHLEMATK